MTEDQQRLTPPPGLLAPPSIAPATQQPSEDDQTPAPPFEAAVLSAADDGSGPRPLSSFAYRPLLSTHLFKTAPAGGWTKARTFDREATLAALVGPAGLIADVRSPYVSPEAQRDFPIKHLDELMTDGKINDHTIDAHTINDGNGRPWQVHSFRLLGAFNLESYCQPLPQGTLCLTTLAPSLNGPLDGAARRNFARATLTPYLIQPAFWRADALADFLRQGLGAADPLMRDFKVTQDQDGGLAVELRTLGLRFLYPAGAAPAMLRLTGGLYQEEEGEKEGAGGMWLAVSHQGLFTEGKTRQLCDVGAEVKDSHAVRALEDLRRREAARRRKARRESGQDAGDGADEGGDGDAQIPGDQVFTAELRGTKLGVPVTVYGYCLPLAPAPGGDPKTLEVGLGEAKAFKIPFEVL
jgi:hypothetical protein